MYRKIPMIYVSLIKLRNFRHTSSFVLNDVTLPKFVSRQHENPLQYLKDLENIFSLRAVSGKSNLLVVKNSLIGHCSLWFDMYIDTIMTYIEFTDLFTDQYWEIRKHNLIRIISLDCDYFMLCN